MSLTIPYTFIGGPGNKAKASEVNANFQAVVAKFTEGAGGITDEDVAGPIDGKKISTVAGDRVPTAGIEDLAVVQSKLAASAVALDKLKLFYFEWAPGAVTISPGQIMTKATGLNGSNCSPIRLELRRSGAPDVGFPGYAWLLPAIYYDTAAGLWYLTLTNAYDGDSGTGLSAYTLRMTYVQP